MDKNILILCLTAASVGFFHTLFGPDHYLPFIVMSKARKWSLTKTMVISFVCGLGHILSSVVLGLIGVALGVAVMKLETFEAFRGSLAAWALIAFGFTYFVWGIHRAIKNKPHTHAHVHDDLTLHQHDHSHSGDHAHVHATEKKSITPWVLFTIFVLGPCEPLIPILMYPAAKNSLSGMLLVTGVFGAVTIGTMLTMVLLMSWGISFMPLGRLEKYTHAIAGGTICLSGIAIQFLGL